jgi:hypothetical protein
MRTTASFILSCLIVVTLAGAASAQPKSSAPSSPPAVVDTRPLDPRQKLRRSIYVMEGALARAVEFGAKDLNRKLRSAIPEMMALSGAPQARGVYLEGYGVYFDVAVPVLNQVMMWSWGRVLGPDDGIVDAISQLKAYIQSEKDPARRASLETDLARLELQIGPLAHADASAPRPAGGGAPAVSAAGASQATAPDVRIDKRYLQDPNAINRAYTESVQNALIETILEHGYPLSIKPDEFLTIAARDNMQRDTLAPFDPFEEVVTILLRLRGSDLAAYRSGHIDEAELRKRIEVREF